MNVQIVPGQATAGTRFSSVKSLGQRPVAFSSARPVLASRGRPFVVRSAADIAKDLDRDEDKEERLKQFRVVYDFERWASHRSTNRYIRHMSGLFRSRILAGLATPLLSVASISTLLCVYEYCKAQGIVGPEYPDLIIKAPVGFNLSSFALSLLLVFRTNSSYGRFDEARKLWGGVVNRSRDVSRQACTYFSPEERDLLEAFIRWQMTFPWALKNHLREEKTWEADLKDILKPEELEVMKRIPHGPNTVLMTLSEICNRTRMTPAERFRIDENLTFFADMAGNCEKILRTPIPVSYTRHTSRFLTLWLFFLPFTIYDKCGWATIPASVVLAFVLLAIEEIGVQIEEPFIILPLEAISTTISTNVKQHLQQTDGVSDLVNETAFSNGANKSLEGLFERR